MKRILFVLFLSSFLPSCFKAEGQSDSFIRKNDSGIEYLLINGEPLDLAEWPFVVRIQTGSAGCSATVIGPKVVVTAGHCGDNGATSQFKIGSKSYQGKVTRSELYPAQDHDVAVIILDTEIPKAEIKKFAHVGGTPAKDQKVFLAGYGCVNPGGGGGNDGVLRGGFATISGFSGYDIISGKSGEAALCFGDSGGPLFVAKDSAKPVIMGVNSKGNIRDTNYNLNLASTESKAFLTKIAKDKGLEICGINGTQANCEDGPNPPPPPPPPGDCDLNSKKQLLLSVAKCFEVPIVLPAGPTSLE